MPAPRRAACGPNRSTPRPRVFLTNGPPALSPLPHFLRLASGEICTCYEVFDVLHLEARELVRVAHNDGRMYLAADCGLWHECDCPVHQAKGCCPHTDALRAAGCFRLKAGWPDVALALASAEEGGEG